MIKALIKISLVTLMCGLHLCYAAGGERVDPTEADGENAPLLKLSATSEANNKFYCVLNDKVMTAGDVVGSYKITDIQLDSVTLTQDDDGVTILAID